jgi:hypothetical protein
VVRQLVPDDSVIYQLALVYVGVNNIISWRWWRRDDLKADLSDIVERMSERSERVAVMQFPDTLGRAGTLFPYGPFLGRRLKMAQAAVACVVAETGSILIPPPDLRGNRIWVDGVHPTSAGHLAMGQVALSVLGLHPMDSFPRALPRDNYDGWRRTEAIRFRLRQPIRGMGTWLLGR